MVILLLILKTYHYLYRIYFPQICCWYHNNRWKIDRIKEHIEKYDWYLLGLESIFLLTTHPIQKYAKIFHNALLLETQTIISVSFDAVGTQCMLCTHLAKTKCFIGGGTCQAKALLNSSEKCVRTEEFYLCSSCNWK